MEKNDWTFALNLENKKKSFFDVIGSPSTSSSNTFQKIQGHFRGRRHRNYANFLTGELWGVMETVTKSYEAKIAFNSIVLEKSNGKDKK